MLTFMNYKYMAQSKTHTQTQFNIPVIKGPIYYITMHSHYRDVKLWISDRTKLWEKRGSPLCDFCFVISTSMHTSLNYCIIKKTTVHITLFFFSGHKMSDTSDLDR